MLLTIMALPLSPAIKRDLAHVTASSTAVNTTSNTGTVTAAVSAVMSPVIAVASYRPAMPNKTSAVIYLSTCRPTTGQPARRRPATARRSSRRLKHVLNGCFWSSASGL